MKADELKEIAERLIEYSEKSDFDKLNELVQATSSKVSSLQPKDDDLSYNQHLKTFIQTYLTVLDQCQGYKQALQDELKKVSRARKGIKQYQDI